MAKKITSRNYSSKTIKLLFGLSGGQCAMPNCNNPIVQPQGDNYDADVLGQICHIYARSPVGPRGDGGLSDDALDSESNLILLCGHHHIEIDANPTVYTPEKLKQIKRDHWQQVQKRLLDLRSVNLSAPTSFPTAIIDEQVKNDLTTLWKCQFYPEFNANTKADILATKIIQGEYSAASDGVKAKGLASCVRHLATADSDKARAESFIRKAKELSDDAEIYVAEAFVLSQLDNNVSISQTLHNAQTPSLISAQLHLIKIRNGVHNALEWLDRTQTTASDLDALGKLVLLKSYLDIEDWSAATSTAETVVSADFSSLPILHHLVGLVHLLAALAEELRTLVLVTVPINAASFPFAADKASFESLRTALNHFQQARSLATDLNCLKAAETSHLYSVWIELMNPSTRPSAVNTLETEFRRKKVPLYLVSLAIQFGIEINTQAVEREIERQFALHGDLPMDAIVARFSLAYWRKTADDFADYIDLHFDSLSSCLQSKILRFTQIIVLAGDHKKARARECLNDLLTSNIQISEAEESYLTELIDASSDEEVISLEVAQFEKTNSITDLGALVDKLESLHKWEPLSIYAKKLFARTHAEQDAERLAIALWNCHRNQELRAFLKSHEYMVANSWNLSMLYCWSTLDAGDIVEARVMFSGLERRSHDANYRNLETMIAIKTGNWSSLLSFTENEFAFRSERTAEELLNAATLADTVGSPRTRDLIIAAAEAGYDDPKVLIGAYRLATRNGWEDEACAFDWFTRARNLSNENGPITQMGVDELVSYLPRWQRAESGVFQLIEKAEVPMISALEHLRRPLSDLVLIPAWANLSESRPQLRTPIPTYSGAQPLQVIQLEGVIGFDYSSLLIIEFLGLLGPVFKQLRSIQIPQSVLMWLFEEKAASRFHQPSRVADALHLQELLVTGVVERLVHTSTPDSDLAGEIGDDLAIVICEAQQKIIDSTPQRVVVRPAPVHSVLVTKRDRVDLKAYSDVLVSCTTIVSKLRLLGVVTESEYDRAVQFLATQEEQWPREPEVLNRAELYLDSLAVWYFLHLGLLSKIRNAGFRVFVLPSLIDTVSSLVSRHGMLDRVQESIEHIRHNVVLGFDRGNVKVGPPSFYDADNEGEIKTIDLIGPLFSMSKCCDVLVSDDRFFNQKSDFGQNGNDVSLVSTASFVHSLSEYSIISDGRRIECFTRLRQAGFLFVPISIDELGRHLQFMRGDFEVNNETAEVKAIRENLLLARMSTVLQVPQEVGWVDRVIGVFIRTVRDLWVTGGDVNDIRSRCDWIVRQVDVRGWAHRLNVDHSVAITRFGRLDLVQTLFVRPAGLSEDLIESYWEWIEEMILSEIRREDPKWYRSLVDQYRSQIFDVVEAQIEQLNEQFGPNAGLEPEVARIASEYFPPLIRQSLLNDNQYQRRFGSSVRHILSFSDGVFASRSDHLFAAVRRILSGEIGAVIHDVNGERWEVLQEYDESEIPVLSVQRDEVHMVLPNFLFLSPEQDIRVRSFERSANEAHLPSRVREVWEKRLRKRSLRDGEVADLLEEFQHTLGYTSNVIRREFGKNEVQVSNLVPSSRKYYESLVGPYCNGDSLDDHVTNCVVDFLDELSRRESGEFLPISLLLSSYSGITKVVPVEHSSDREFNEMVSRLCESGDRLSQLGAIEVGLRVIDDRPSIEPGIIKLTRILDNDDGTHDVSGYRLQASLFKLVEYELSSRRVLVGVPPFYRRLASLAHSSVIHRYIIPSGIDVASFCDYVDGKCSLRFQLQSLVDMRVEPRWEPTFSSPIYFRSEFLGRIVATGVEFLQGADGRDIHEVVLGESKSSLQAQMEFPSWYFAGPLEGGRDLTRVLPPSLVVDIESQLSVNQVTPNSFIALINSAFLGSIKRLQSKLASEALERSRNRVRNVEDRNQLLTILYGLARVSAYSRSSELAESLRLVSRNYRGDRQFPLTVEEEIRIILMSAACFSELDEWCKFVGMWIRELAFGGLENNECRRLLHWMLQVLCDIEPALWSYCGAADAALAGDYVVQQDPN